MNTLNIGLAGQPNTGKSTLFNRLTGARQHVGNWPGKTIEQKSGEFSQGDKTIRLVDLPGTYSLSANSPEELIARHYIVTDEMDTLVLMVDASQLHRSCYLLAEIIGINTRVVVVCTMVDVARAQGKSIDFEKLEQRLKLPVAAINASTGEGMDGLKKKLATLPGKWAGIPKGPLENKYRSILGDAFDRLVRQLPEQGIEKYSSGWLAARLIEGDTEILELVKSVCGDKRCAHIRNLASGIKDGPLAVANARYAWIRELLTGIVSSQKRDRVFTIKGFDRLATHGLWGKGLALAMILLGISGSLTLASPVLMGLYTYVLPLLAKLISRTLTAWQVPMIINSFVCDALFPGISIACMAVLFIMISIFFFSVMENIGYVSRVAYVFDSWMARLGLHGKSILPFISGFLCNIIGVAGSRVIDSAAQRRTTIAASLAVPCMSCWGVILLVASIFFGINAVWVVGALLLATLMHITVTAWLFRDRSQKRKDAPGLIMELPPYHKPSWQAIFHFVMGRTKIVAAKAGTAILVAVLLIWALSYSATGGITGGILYKFGKAIEPFSMVIGFDWRLLIAIIFSAFAKEASLGVIAILFGVGELGTSLSGTILSPVIYDAGQLTHVMGSTISKASALAFIFGFYFNVPCFATIAIIRSETLSIGFTAVIAGYYFLVAMAMAGIAYRFGLMIF